MANRKKQIAAIQASIEPIAQELYGLIEDLQESYDNTPESIQMGDRGDAMQERIDMLQSWYDHLEEMMEEEI